MATSIGGIDSALALMVTPDKQGLEMKRKIATPQALEPLPKWTLHLWKDPLSWPARALYRLCVDNDVLLPPIA